MYSESDLDSAGVLRRAAAGAFRQHVAAQRQALAIDEERFRPRP